MKQQILEKRVKALEEVNANLAGRLMVARELSSYLGVHLREVTPEGAFEQLMEDAEAHLLAKFADILAAEAESDVAHSV